MSIFTVVASISLGLAFLCAIIIAIDELRHPQKMWIMNVVWPITALYFSVFAVWGYFRAGRKMTKDAMAETSEEQHEKKTIEARLDPTIAQTAISDSPCGAGCTLGDIISEFSIFGLRHNWGDRQLG